MIVARIRFAHRSKVEDGRRGAIDRRLVTVPLVDEGRGAGGVDLEPGIAPLVTVRASGWFTIWGGLPKGGLSSATKRSAPPALWTALSPNIALP